MSNALAIAAVTAALKDLIGNGLLGLDLSSIGSVTVSALPPDRIATGQTEPNQLNLFLYQVTPNTGWRNHALPARDANGARIGNPPLALDLHYMLTAYGAQDLSAEALLGFAMQFLHETPMLSRAQLRTVLGPPSPPFGNLSALSLAEQVEWLKITPQFLGAEELSKLWTAMQARYRPSMAYQVSVVLIESDATARAALPVLKRGAGDRGPFAMANAGPSLNRVRPALSDLLPAARLGDELLLSGHRLHADGVSAVFENARTDSVQTLPTIAGTNDRELRVQLPNAADAGAMAGWGIGMYALRLRSDTPGVPTMYSNAVPMALSPQIVVSPLAAAPGDIAMSIVCSPRLHPTQNEHVRLIFGDIEIAADTIDTPADETQPTTLTFTVRDAVAGSYPIRLRVDGIDSLPIQITPGTGIDFDPQQTVVVA
jgi:Pvc16 N-terminal domain